MAFLFEPVTAAIETLKYIKSASSKGPDPARFITRTPLYPGKWALNLCFKRRHNIWKWSMYQPAMVPRKRKIKKGQRIKLIKHEDDDAESVDTNKDITDVEPVVQVPGSSQLLPHITISSRKTSGHGGYSPPESSMRLKKRSSTTPPGQALDEDEMPFFPIPDDEDSEAEARLMAEMSPEQKVYYRSCEHFKVKALRVVMRQIETPEMALTHIKMKDLEFKALTTSLVMNFTVKRLDLTETMLTEQQTTYLMDFLEDDNGITDLILKDNKMEGRFFARMFESMKYRDVMIYLDISGNNLRDKDIPNLAAYIESSSQLSFLHMARNKFTSKAGEPLGKMMAQASLLELDVSANQIRGDGMISFLNFVAKSGSLERLNVSWNGIGPEAVRGLVNLIKQSSSLIELDLSSTRINGECLDMITTLGLSKNSVLQRLILKNNPLLTQDLTTLLTRVYNFPNTGIRRFDFGDYQVLDHSVGELLEALFWEKQIYVKSAGPFTFSKHTQRLESLLDNLRQDSLSVVTRLTHGQRTALVKHFAQLDMQEAVEQGSEIIATSFLGRANENKVTYKDLALRINQEKKDPRDVVNSLLTKEDEENVEKNKMTISRFSFTPEAIRKIHVMSRAS